MPRAKHFFQETFTLEPLNKKYQLTFIESENIGIKEKILRIGPPREIKRIEKIISTPGKHDIVITGNSKSAEENP